MVVGRMAVTLVWGLDDGCRPCMIEADYVEESGGGRSAVRLIMESILC